ncbi:MAG: hypothetical protein EXR98_10320 [Gemmataceae bacterium]|nr:hypothetical protein [Gemmataceae bacterium]
MHEKHASKGLVIITVSVDDPEKKEDIAEANEFLRKRKLPFSSFHLTEASELWNKKLDFACPPCYYIFDRQGKWARFRGADYKTGIPEEEMDKVILRMLAE